MKGDKDDMKGIYPDNVVVITGSSNGIGKATARYFAERNFEVHGIDKLDAPNSLKKFKNFYEHKLDVRAVSKYPNIEGVSILINNAGVQDRDAIEVNLLGTIQCTNKYGLQPYIRSICNLASVSAHNGAEFDLYTASKGGILAYTKWTAKQVAQYGATCNSISFGGVYTDLNNSVIEDDKSWKEIMDMTPLKKWATPEECAEWIYFLTVINQSCTGQDIIIDNGEFYNHTFVWKE